MESILTWFSTSRQLYEKYFDMIFHRKATIWKVFLTWFSTSRRLKTSLQSMRKEILKWFFQFKTAQNVVRRHYERDFDMIFHLQLETAQKLVRQQHERDFHMIFHFKKFRKISCRAALWRKFWHQFLLYGASNLDCRALKKRFWHNFPREGSSKLRCRAVWNRFWQNFPSLWLLKNWLRSSVK